MRHRQEPKLTGRRRRLRYAARKLLSAAAVAAVVGGLVLADRLGVFGQRGDSEHEKYHGRSFRVARVVDGDTIDVEIPDGQYPTTRVRLWGVDTPEIGNKRKNKPPAYFGPEASAFAKHLCAGRTVTLKLEPAKAPRDRYGRLLAWVYLPSGELLNRVLVEEGYGYADPRFEHHLRREFSRAQDKAMRAGIGLWAKATNEDLPYYYRDKLKSLPGRSAAGRPK
jgi:endonuclease YncB( thermonuclease family)